MKINSVIQRIAALRFPITLQKLFGTGCYLFLLYLALRETAEQRFVSVLATFGVFGILWLFPWLLLYGELSIGQTGIEYRRWIKQHEAQWEEIMSVGSVFWFPARVLVVRVKRKPWPVCYVCSDDTKLRRVPGSRFWHLEGEKARAIRSLLTECSKQ